MWPPGVGFRQAKLANENDSPRAIARPPFKWVAGDTVYGVWESNSNTQSRQTTSRGRHAHVFRSGASGSRVAGNGEDIAGRGARPTETPVGRAGTTGPLLHDWCYLELPIRGRIIQQRNQVFGHEVADPSSYRRCDSPSSPPGSRRTILETLVAVEGHRGPIEDSF